MALFKKNDNNFQWADDFVEGFLKPMDRHTSLFLSANRAISRGLTHKPQ
ncbi:TPA: hypothetical protein ACSTJY_002126 [Serratia fonticola]|jgi:hypothetical protein|nr:hypothetical protein [Serratia fonticola]HBE9181074.1 hypothetical protein [Serratia fonticola]